MSSPAWTAWCTDDGNQSWKIVVSTAVGFALATFAIVGRVASRWLCRKRLEANDYLAVAAYFPKLGIDIASIMLIQYGIGRHLDSLTSESITNYLKVLYSAPYLYTPTRTSIKLSILCLYWTAFPTPFVRRSVIALAAIILAWGIGVFLVGVLACLPISKAWDPSVPGTCVDLHGFYYGLQIPNIATDFAIFLLPFKPVWELRLPTRQKAWMCAGLCLALVTCAFDVVRLVVLARLPGGEDFTWNQTSAAAWTDLEASVAIFVACLPIMRPLLHPKEFLRRRREGHKDDEGDEDDRRQTQAQTGGRAEDEEAQ